MATPSLETAITTRVHFQTVRENLGVLVVLDHYGFDVKQNGQDQVKICCPFHNDKNPSCGLNTKKRVFNCFSCGEKGNILDFFAKMEGFDPDKLHELVTASQMIRNDIDVTLTVTGTGRSSCQL